VVSSIYNAALAAGVARDGWMLAVGGGALSDAVGFAAATYLRGVPWAVLPTTLLAQVDAALGGKTAIDLPQGKNLVGAFHLPRAVLIDPLWLATLPEREWRSGFGEVLKAGLLTGGELWQAVETAPPGFLDPEPVTVLVEAAARMKLRVVREDPREAGARAYLNLGHTLGHAWEAWAGFSRVSHGEAVGVGLLGALWLSERVLGLAPGVREATFRVLERWHMPVGIPGVPAGELLAILAHDKKRQDKILRWVLLEQPGVPCLRPVPEELVMEMLAALGAATEDVGVKG
jgi:3-dehydroquinate synthetase